MKRLLSLNGNFIAGGRPSLFGVAGLPYFETLFDMPAERLLADHTVIPYATAYAEDGVWARVEAFVASPDNSTGVTATLQSAIQGVPHRRFCEACVAEDLSRLGESYWRISHQLPGCFVCHRHRGVLRACDLLVKGSAASYDLPQDCSGSPMLSDDHPRPWLDIATAAAAAAGRGLQLPATRGRSYYRTLADRLGWRQEGRSVDGALVTSLLVKLYSGKLLERAGARVNAKGMSWVSLMLQSGAGTPFSTLKHQLMERFLAETSVDVSHRPTGPSQRAHGREESDRMFAAAARKVAKRYSAEGKRLRKVVLLREAGCLSQYRHLGAKEYPRLYRAVNAIQQAATAYRPMALMQLRVPGERERLATRQYLVKEGHLLSSKDAAAQLGVHWTEMKALQRAARIPHIRFARRDWYPTFWCVPMPERLRLEQILKSLLHLDLAGQWNAMVEAAGQPQPTCSATSERSFSHGEASSQLGGTPSLIRIKP